MVRYMVRHAEHFRFCERYLSFQFMDRIDCVLFKFLVLRSYEMPGIFYVGNRKPSFMQFGFIFLVGTKLAHVRGIDVMFSRCV